MPSERFNQVQENLNTIARSLHRDPIANREVSSLIYNTAALIEAAKDLNETTELMNKFREGIDEL